MINPRDIKRLHGRAWGSSPAYEALPKLALETLRAIEGGSPDPAHVINYAAILLDLHRNDEALEWLASHPVSYREYYVNLAIACAKTQSSNDETIRKYNTMANKLPSCENSIEAYMDWHGL